MCNKCGQNTGCGCGNSGCGNLPVYGQSGCGCGGYPVPENDGISLASDGGDVYGSGRRGGGHGHGCGCGCNCSLGCRLTNALRRFLFGCGCGR